MNKKILRILLVTGIIILIILLGIIVLLKMNKIKVKEYTPQEEISEEQLRQTLVTLYFKNKSAGHLMPEARLIDAKLLIENPYMHLVELLIEGPKNESLVKIIPEGTKINKAELNKGVVELDFSSEFIQHVSIGEEEEKKIVQSIVATLFELTEVNAVKITINGEENKAFEDNAVNFKTIFVKEDI